MSKIYYYTTILNNIPIKEFIMSLNKQQKPKVVRILRIIEEYGLKFSSPYTKKLSGTNLWEIRILGRDNIRIIHAIIYNQDVLLLHGFFKKKQKTPKKDLEISIDRHHDWINRFGH
ncbi:MAG: Gp49-like protein PF05973 family protein [Candidatus Woesebacteria bacterium GW2011_GWA1_33_30]|uniref:Gp49-like protein PF05973 family protein n=1 Tax=Candidatus Woesebacteria bacterium GW2011_GWA2_33_28 TaxID=1618561 RepID=A0A0G0C9A0_9BACT|nr:MAG: Gp49-like protein PF05973 family protein [Candidatus Woesebacteria bacterium GW2011_GWA2_33_28]KKP48622.1 MAG: Gp49-like protein PF05973 family protein [Candidatus Woesebacteria bacterium GW2011_GWA1_33_30]KKP49761.1 MAG: Gp49-like protein PF05973 family protein [Microgenomates group bacterium GW2011_GWC1_33_32]KKP52378.1 MAG: Gp49-like protein PF05973 family protein [Candidatus Woesebacteria bacterium GW2011_GWB1_33_38]KKP57108.1 MAG: Gp49-like protein PF05973 family protein [Microgeno